MFALAEAARQKGMISTTEAAYRVLSQDADVQIRTEARFRLGMMLTSLGRPAEAGPLFRQILDEQPTAQRVRLELAPHPRPDRRRSRRARAFSGKRKRVGFRPL